MNFEFSSLELINCLRKCGIESGDIVCLQVSLGRVGLVKESGFSYIKSIDLLIKCFLEVIEEQGTLVVPCYSYSMSNGNVFNVDETKSTIGEFSEHFRKLKGVFRSEDPILSHCALGQKAKEITKIYSRTCFGENSFFDISKKLGAKICTLGLAIYNSTFIHHIEQMSNVPFRYKKKFTGEIIKNKISREETWEYFAAPRILNCHSNPIALQEIAFKRGKVKIENIGRGQIMCIDSNAYFNLGTKELLLNPWLTAKGPCLDQNKLNELFKIDKRLIGN